MNITGSIDRDAEGRVPRPPDAPVVGAPTEIDPEVAAGLAAMQEILPANIVPETIAQCREITSTLATATDDDLRRDGTYTFTERNVPGPAGAPDITLLICMPSDSHGPVPAIYNVHGGGMIMSSHRTGIQTILDLAAPLGAAVISVEYRLAPENPDPAPVEDCYAGLVWTAENAGALGIDPDQIIIVGGSAGGGLAAGVTLLARDRGAPRLLGQLLMCPMIDDRDDTASTLQMGASGVWDRTANRTGWQALLGERQGGPDVSPYAAPARATDLSGLPPTLIDVGSAEIFRDESITYAARILQAGGTAELHVWPGGFHGYEMAAPFAGISLATIRARNDWLARLLTK